MKVNHSRVKRLFDPDAIDKLQKADARFPELLKAVSTIIEDYLTEFEKQMPIDDTNWALKRAHRDGFVTALKDLHNIFEEE